MGYSQSVAVLIITIGLVFSLTTVGPAVTGAVSDAGEALKGVGENNREIKNENYRIHNATYNSSADELRVKVNVTGASNLDLVRLDLLVDGEYTHPDVVYVNGVSGRTFAGSGASVEIVVSMTKQPVRVKLVSENGIARTAEVVAV